MMCQHQAHFTLPQLEAFHRAEPMKRTGDAPPPQRRILPQAHLEKVKQMNLFRVSANLLVELAGSDNLKSVNLLP